MHTAPVRRFARLAPLAARRLAPLAAFALATAVGLSGITAPAARAADGFAETATTTYTLQPAKGRLAVKVTLRITNSTPDTTEPYECTKYREDWFWGTVPYTDTCYRTTHWYRNQASIWVEREAGKVKATSGGKRLAVESSQKGDAYRLETITFPKLFYGKSRTITVTYTLKGGSPRSDTFTRTLRAYASFCVIANGADKGEVTVRLPSGFKVETSGEPLRGKVDGGSRVFTSGAVKDTSRWYACLSGTNEDGYTAEEMTAPDGRTVRLLSWPEDPTWTRGVRDEVSAGLPELRRLVGADMAGSDALVVKEASTGNEYAGFYDRKSNTITVGEDYTQPSLVAHELAHVWFNGSVFAETWMSEGYAEWAGRTASGDLAACGRPEAAPASLTLADWRYLEPRSSAEERDAVSAQYDASCYIVTRVAQAAGADRMATVTTALLGRDDPYAPGSDMARATKIATWRDWLDAVDELGLRPAGAAEGLASDLLVEYGIASDRALLAKRASARRAYQELLATVVMWDVPPVVRTPLTEWHFDDAQAAIAAAGETWEVTGQTDLVLDGVEARQGPAASAWEGAASLADLEEAASIARRQLVASKDVAEVRELLEQRLDLVEQVGMVGTVMPSLDSAVAAIRVGDDASAAEITLRVRSMLGGLRAQGEQRIVLGVGIAILVLALAVVLVAWRVQVSSRRRRAGRMAAAGAAGVGPGPVPVGTSASPDGFNNDSTATVVDLPGVAGPLPAWASPSIDDSPTMAVPDLGAPAGAPAGAPVEPPLEPPSSRRCPLPRRRFAEPRGIDAMGAPGAARFSSSHQVGATSGQPAIPPPGAS